MEREFDTELLGKNITFTDGWSHVSGTIDMRQEAIGTRENPSIVRMRRINGRETMITFRHGAIVVAEEDRIRYNVHDVINTE